MGHNPFRFRTRRTTSFVLKSRRPLGSPTFHKRATKSFVLKCQFVGDSRNVVDGFLGHASFQDSLLRRPLKVAHTGLQTLVESFSIQPPPFADFAKQVPRSDNTAADAAANWALDNRSFDLP